MSEQADLLRRAESLLSDHPLDDPYPLYAEMREAAPVMEIGEFTIVTRWQDVRDVLTDDGHFLSNHFQPDTVEGKRQRAQLGELSDEEQVLFADIQAFGDKLIAWSLPPDHARRREAFRRAFSARAVAALETETQDVIDTLLAPLAGSTEVDLVGELATLLPRHIHTRLLGVPRSDFALLEEWRTRAAPFLGGASVERMRPYHSMIQEFKAYVAELVAVRRRTPDAMPFMTTLIEALDAGEISADELTAACAVVLLNGTQTAAALIACGMLTMLRRPQQWALLCEQPGLAPHAVEECLRFEAPVQVTGRNVAPGAAIAGHQVGEGRRVLAVIAAANHDPAVFEAPDEFDFTRTDGHHKLSFAVGSHACLGAALARLEARAVFSTVARRHPGIKLVAEPVSWKPSCVVRAPARLAVVLGCANRSSARIADDAIVN